MDDSRFEACAQQAVQKLIVAKLIQGGQCEASLIYKQNDELFKGQKDCLRQLRLDVQPYVDADLIPSLFPGIIDD